MLRRSAEALQGSLRIIIGRTEVQRRAVIRNSLFALAELLVYFRARLNICGTLGCNFHCLFGVGEAFGVLTFQMMGPCTRIVSARKIWLECNRLAEIGDCRIVQTFV